MRGASRQVQSPGLTLWATCWGAIFRPLSANPHNRLTNCLTARTLL